MNRLLRRLILGASLLLVLTVILGCGDKHHKMRVIEEQREGEVTEQGRGSEMVVE
jgi:hypothetical protein